MTIAYIFSSQGRTVLFKRGTGILPQLENDTHGVEVVGCFPGLYAALAGNSPGQVITL